MNVNDHPTIFAEKHLKTKHQSSFQKITVAVHEDPQPYKEKQTKHMITDVRAHTHAGEHIHVQIISQRLTQVLSPTSPPPILPLLCSFPLPSNTTQNIDTSPPPSSLSLSLSITHFLYWILIGCLLRGLSFKSLLLQSLNPYKKTAT